MNLPNDQFSVKFYIARILLVIPYIKKNYKFLLIGALIGGLFGTLIDFYKSKEEKYESEIIFTIEAPNSGEPTGLSSMFGLGSGNESTNLFSSGNFEELVKLPLVYNKALLTKVKINNEEDFFINYFLKKTNDEDIVEMKLNPIPKNINLDSLSINQKSVVHICAESLKSGTKFSKGNEKSSFRTLIVTTNNDTLSYYWSTTLLNTFSDIYIKNKTRKTSELVRILGKRVDSLRNALFFTQGKLARFADQNQQIIFQSAKITADRLQMNSTQLQGLYNEAVRNYDSYKFSLAKESPLLNIISSSELPIFIEEYTIGKFILIGTIIGLILLILLQYIIKVYKEVFND